jgi:ribonuclease G
MANLLIVNATAQETRVAALENGLITDFYLERKRHRGVVGNIYKGRVSRVLPGMQAAFVDIGLEKAGFLYVADVHSEHNPLEIEDGDEDGGENGRGGARRRRDVPPIEEQLKEGQEVLVQVVKDPIGTKGARVTSHISLPGRHLVFMPTVDHIGISRQIASESERKRLRNIANEMRPRGGGFIVRTASAGISSRFLKHDMGLLVGLWNEMLERRGKVKAPAVLYEDLDLILRATRDLATAKLDKLVVDSHEQYDRIMEFIERYMPRFASRVELYVGKEPIFDAYGIEAEIQGALARNATLPSGGYLVIERTEALTSIDINTGRFVGKTTLEETILKTNIEAAAEIAYQLRLRNIGGLIIIDFIDMESASHRDQVYKALEKALESDRGRVKITRISEFGILEMTRKRTRESLEQMLCEPCPACTGLGRVKAAETVAHEMLRELHRCLPGLVEYDVHVVAAPSVVALLTHRERTSLRELEERFGKKLHLRSDHGAPPDRYEITGTPTRTVRAH